MLLWGGGRGACGAVRAVQVSSIGWPATACMGVWERGAATGPSALTGRGPSAAAAWRHGRPRHGVYLGSAFGCGGFPNPVDDRGGRPHDSTVWSCLTVDVQLDKELSRTPASES
jgi:hypothetical protein